MSADFEAAAAWIQNLPKDGPIQATNDEKLIAYGLYKQVTCGPNKTDKPGMFSGFEAGYKWDAWKKNEKMSKEEAEKAYVAHINGLKKKYEKK